MRSRLSHEESGGRPLRTISFGTEPIRMTCFDDDGNEDDDGIGKRGSGGARDEESIGSSDEHPHGHGPEDERPLAEREWEYDGTRLDDGRHQAESAGRMQKAEGARTSTPTSASHTPHVASTTSTPTLPLVASSTPPTSMPSAGTASINHMTNPRTNPMTVPSSLALAAVDEDHVQSSPVKASQARSSTLLAAVDEDREVAGPVDDNDDKDSNDQVEVRISLDASRGSVGDGGRRSARRRRIALGTEELRRSVRRLSDVRRLSGRLMLGTTHVR